MTKTKAPKALTTGDLEAFSPTRAQSIAKSRLQARLREAEGLFDLESMTLDQVVDLSGTSRTRKWLKEDPQFAAWLFDQDAFSHRANALKERSLEILEELMSAEMDGKCVTGKTKLDAVKLVMELTGSFPSRTKEVRYVDEEVGRMPEHQVDQALEEYRAKLSPANPAEEPSGDPQERK